VQYRVGGRTRRMTLGPVGTLAVADARMLARKTLAKVLTGGDPQGERHSHRRQSKITLQFVAGEYISARQGKVRPHTLIEVTRYLQAGYFKPLHMVPIEQVTRKQIAACILDIERRSGSVAAARARSALAAMFSWAMTAGIAESNPTIGCYKPDSPKSRDRVLSDHELAAVWRASGAGEFGLIVKLLVLLGCRRKEVGGMAWSELDSERGTWTLPGSRAKNHREHVLPLPPLAWEIIETVPHVVGRDQLFGARSSVGFTEWERQKGYLDDRLGDAVAPFTLHDLRRTLATRLCDLGVAPHVVEQILNHQSGHRHSVAAIYNKSIYAREVRAALALWADHIGTLVEGRPRKVTALDQHRRPVVAAT
jgi:integrase